MRFQNFTSGGKICPMYFVHALFIRFIQIYKGSHTSFFPQTSKSYINKNILEHFGLFIFGITVWTEIKYAGFEIDALL